MFTKAYKFSLNTLKSYVYEKNPGVFPAKNTNGTTRYLGSSNPQVNCWLIQWDAVKTYGSTPTQTGVSFTDDNTPFVDNDTIYSYLTPQNITISLSNKSASYTSNSIVNSLRYILTNSGSSPVTIRKMFAITLLPCSSTIGSNATSSTSNDKYFLSYVKELETPVEVPANGTAVIDVTVETDIS